MIEKRDIELVYDKECPACDLYCRLVDIDESAGRLRRVDARDNSEVMTEVTELGLDIDEGMVLRTRDNLFYGPDAIHQLALLSSRKGFFNKMVYATFRSKTVSRVLYPVLKACRNLLLKLLGRTRINNLGIEGRDRF